jgi:Chlamydia polymorphic membrane protein (Chlamydia_PMP) repeat
MCAMLQCRFQNNTATDAGGGAVTTFQSTHLSISGCTFEGNKAGTLIVQLQLHYLFFMTTCASVSSPCGPQLNAQDINIQTQ